MTSTPILILGGYGNAGLAIARLLQYLDSSLRKPGLWRQATLVEPVRFFDDLARFGVQVKMELC